MNQASKPETKEDGRLVDVRRALADGATDRAIGLAIAALKGGFVHPLLLTLRARHAEDAGRFAESLADLRRAQTMAPGDAAILDALGACLTRHGQLGESLNVLERATTLAPAMAEAWNHRGLAQLAAGDVTGARSSFQAATTLNPTLIEPLGQLALLAARRGDWKDVRATASAALALDASDVNAQRALAEADIAEGNFSLAEHRLRIQLAGSKLRPMAHYQALGLLGDALDRQGRYPEAFAAYQSGNQQLQQIYAGRFARSGLVEAVETLRSAVEKDWPRAAAHTPPTTVFPCARSHVFLIGFMRSGTTLIEQVLAAQPDIVTLEEQEALASGVNAFMTGREGMTRLRDADEATLATHRADYWTQVRRFGVDPTDRIFVDKKPFDGIKLPLIRRLFPEAKIIFTIRDPRDVIFSCFRHRFGITSYTYELLNLNSSVRYYDVYMRSVETYRERLSLNLYAYRHEDLVADFEGQVRAICDFLGLAWRDDMRDVGRRPREGQVSSPSALQLVNGLSRSGLQQWRRYRDQLASSYAALEPWVRRFGYD